MYAINDLHLIYIQLLSPPSGGTWPSDQPGVVQVKAGVRRNHVHDGPGTLQTCLHEPTRTLSCGPGVHCRHRRSPQGLWDDESGPHLFCNSRQWDAWRSPVVFNWSILSHFHLLGITERSELWPLKINTLICCCVFAAKHGTVKQMALYSRRFLGERTKLPWYSNYNVILNQPQIKKTPKNISTNWNIRKGEEKFTLC